MIKRSAISILVAMQQLIATDALADSKIECSITPEVWVYDNVPVPRKSNNLRRITASAEIAKGDPIVIQGRVLDNSCTPISDAVVEIWQVDGIGGASYLKNGGVKADKNFAGSGTTITNNKGYYSFFTVMPGIGGDNRAPHITIKIKHNSFREFWSTIYFPGHALTAADAKLLNKQVPEYKRQQLFARYVESKDGFEIYNYDISLNESAKYRKY